MSTWPTAYTHIHLDIIFAANAITEIYPFSKLLNWWVTRPRWFLRYIHTWTIPRNLLTAWQTFHCNCATAVPWQRTNFDTLYEAKNSQKAWKIQHIQLNIWYIQPRLNISEKQPVLIIIQENNPLFKPFVLLIVPFLCQHRLKTTIFYDRLNV